MKLLNMGALEAQRIAKKQKKKNPDPGFSDYEQATIRQYNRNIKGIKPNMEAYEEAKEKLGPAFYGDRNTILHGLVEDKKEAVDKMVEDLEKQWVSFYNMLSNHFSIRHFLFYTIFQTTFLLVF